VQHPAEVLEHIVERLSLRMSASELLPFTGLQKPGGVAVDAAHRCDVMRCSVYVTDEGNNRVLKLAVG
jgi:hypothetical protein